MESKFRTAIPQSDQEFHQYYNLRWEVLRKPWNQPLGSEKDELESKSIHRMICDEDGAVVGVGRLQMNNRVEAQIRYMAVHPKFHRLGIGRMVVDALEQAAVNHHAEMIILYARENAMSFYQALGYETIEKSYILYDTIQHYKLRKILT